MDMPKPTAGHARLDLLAGRWEGEDTMLPSQWDPKGGTAIARTDSRIALNGFALISDYEQERDGVIAFAGHGVMTFDPASELYSLHWFDVMGTPPELFQGRFEDNRLTLAHGGPGMHARLTYDLTESPVLRTGMEMSEDGVTWMTLFTGRYQRI